MSRITRLLESLSGPSSTEQVDILWTRPGLRLERIVSWGQTTAPGQWYDQDQDEWVMVVTGAARLHIEGHDVDEMGPGDSVLLPAHCRHRVEWTAPDRPTVWLALHCWPA